MKNVIILGKGNLGIPLAKWIMNRPNDYNLLAIVPVIPEPDWSKSFIEFAREYKIPFSEKGELSDIKNILDDNIIHLGISIFFETIFKQIEIDKFQLLLNLHLSPLPKYRGVRPINWALKNGETEHGTTIIKVIPGIDEGPIISQMKFSIFPEEEEVIDVFKRSLNYSFQLLIETLPMLGKIKPRPQNHSQASYFSRKQNKELGEWMSFMKPKNKIKLIQEEPKINDQIRPFISSDLKNILSMISRSDSTNRTKSSWTLNNMTGMLAFKNNKLIGAIPYEPRNFSLGNSETFKILWVSAAHVDPEYRSLGIGSQLDQEARKIFAPKFQGIFLYRGDENSLAYKWYTRLGYQELLKILALKIDVPDKKTNANYKLVSLLKEIKHFGKEILNCYNLYCGKFGGVPCRYQSFWYDKLNSHYYGKNYSFSLILIQDGEKIVSYAILGEREKSDPHKRIDILEYCCADKNFDRERLISAVILEAQKRKINEVCIQISSQDPGFNWFFDYGFVYRWRTNIMGTLINPEKYFSDKVKDCKELQTCSINIETPSFRISHNCSGIRKRLGLFMSDKELVSLLLYRTQLKNAIEESRILVTQYDNLELQKFGKIFQSRKWIYNHIDYI